MQSSKRRTSNHQNPVPLVPPTIWHQLPESHQQQLVHLVAQLIQRLRQATSGKEGNYEH